MKFKGQRAMLVAALTGTSFLFAFPVFWMFLTALRPTNEIFSRSLHFWPSHPAWQNIPHAFAMYPITSWLLNSATITVAGTVLSVFVDLLAGYAFAKFQFPGRDWIFLCYLASLMLPAQVLLVPQFLGVAAAGGVNTLWAVVLPRCAEAYGIFLARQLLTAIPDELLDAARLEGAGEWTIFWRIVLPLSLPAVAVLSLMLALGFWNDFGWPLVVLQDLDRMTLPVGLSIPQGEHISDWSGLMVIALASTLPILTLFVGLQRYFVQGFSRSGLK